MKCQLSLLAFAALAPSVHAQGSRFTGRVLTDSGVPLIGAEVVLAAQRTRTNSIGQFRLDSLRTGEYVVVVRMPGYAPKGDTIEVEEAGEVRREYRLSRTLAILPEVPVVTTLVDRMLADFHDRRRFGAGRFLDSTEFAKASGTRTSDKLRRLPGLIITRGRFSESYVTSTRGRCPASIWVDGLHFGTGYDVNMFDAGSIVAVEWYSSPATIPVEFGMSKPGVRACAVLVLYTR
jgi:hypothetical protein